MFLTAAKTALVEALRTTFDVEIESVPEAVKPRKVSVEYSLEKENWPFILVQLRIADIRWTGIVPDVIEEDPDVPGQYQSLRYGQFAGTCDIEILALTSEERDRMWDTIVKILLMGRKRSETAQFYTTLEQHDLIKMTIQEGVPSPGGDVISPGTPWDPEALTYEAMLSFDLVGQFVADEYTQDLVPITSVEVFPYDDTEEPYGEGDDRGPWNQVG